MKQLKTEIDSASHDDSIKPFILLVVEQREEGLKAANNLLQKTNANPVITSGHPILQRTCYMVNIYQMKLVPYTIRRFYHSINA